MLLLVIIIIVLGWAAFGISLGRDAMRSKTKKSSAIAGNGSLGQIPSPYLARRSGPFGIPQTNEAARIRRQHVLISLITAAVSTYFLTRLWTLFWALHIAVDVALVVFVIALYLRSTNALPTTVQPTRRVRIEPAH